MKAGRIAWSIVGLLSLSAAARAGPVLLASWRIGNSFSTPQIVTSARPALFYLGPNNEILSPIFEEFPTPSAFPSVLDDTISSELDPDFASFVQRLINGVDEELIVVAWSPSGPLSGGGGTESAMLFAVPRLGPDLVGYQIDHIREVLAVDLQTPGSDPFGNGINTDWSVSGRYEFYGTAIPDPSAVVLLLFGAICAFPYWIPGTPYLFIAVGRGMW